MEYAVEFIKVKDIKPYEKNAKKHPQEQIEYIKNSIKEFGFRQNLVIDKDNVIIIGHGRLEAAKQLGLEYVPCIKAEDLTEDQIKALRLADNKVAESEWDFDFLNEELDNILDIDMTDFGFDINIDNENDDTDVIEDDRDPSCQHNVFENQELAQFDNIGYYGIPIMEPTDTSGDKFLRFMDYNLIEDHSEHIAHFYYDDYKFIEAWRNPDKYIEKLREFKAVISPDFSLYTDFPRTLQILSCYRRQWVGAYWQSAGLDVIPDVVWGDKESFNYCFDGIPKHSTVAVSSVGVKNDKDWNGKEADMFKAGYNEMLNRLKPKKILFYGDMIDGLDGDIIQIPSYYAEKREYLNEKARAKKKKQKRSS